ncbi:GNAT family N-acetyltransferase [Microbacterium paludicola]|jgi:putative acetyltransferase|uniref:GNAT family N-acetyltransferase n=1 Tax=Microbacterium paludicola TaxID=300019 RepID=UPI00090377B2|nr:GNAT family N-acetyltransferase [Microbacterium paludicola]APF32894.1 GNAT family N-acetyltransferase [Microbacterium paludicola]
MAGSVTIVRDDLTGAATRGLLAAHLAGMLANTPVESVHALDLTALQHPSVRVYSAWVGDEIAAVGAYKAFDGDRAEIKSMRVADGFLGRGLGRAMLQHLEREARDAGIRSLWLETGSGPDFVAARSLYESAGFSYCPPFGDYSPDPLSVFMTRDLEAAPR